MKGTILTAAFGLSALALAAPAAAQFARADAWRPSYRDDRAPYYQARRAAYDNGYREGVKEGEKDGRSRDRFEFQDEKDFQRADVGYHREYGDRERYRQSFRSGFADGYADGYRRFSNRNDGGWRAPGNGRYNGRFPGGYGGGYGYTNFAFENGLKDGHEKGLEDARARRTADVLRHRWYRSGDREYDSRYGPRQQYADQYRNGFKEGYARGYRELRRW